MSTEDLVNHPAPDNDSQPAALPAEAEPRREVEERLRGPTLIVPAQAPEETAAEASGPAQELSPPRVRSLSKTEQLIADVIAAGGVLRVPYWRKDGEPDYQQRVFAAQRFGKVPAGKRLDARQVQGELEIRLEDALPGTAEIILASVPVPARLSRPHAVAARFRDDTDRHLVSKATLPRAVRIVHAIATEAERRGYKVANADAPAPERHSRSTSGANVEHLVITIKEHRYRFQLAEEKVPLRAVWEEQARWRAQYPYGHLGVQRRIGRYDAEATGRLTITLSGGGGREGRVASWGDRKSWSLDDKLGELLREIEIRAIEDDHRDAEEKRKAEERQRQWELAMERAKERFMEMHRTKTLRSQIADWQEAQVAAAYLAALEEKYGDALEAAEWIEWIRGFVARLDPLHSAPKMPEEPEIKPDDLKPFLGGLSPYGPRGW